VPARCISFVALIFAAAVVLLVRPATAAVAQTLPFPASSRIVAEPLYDFYARGPYRAAVPKPSAILGYQAGEMHTTYRDQERTLLAIAQAAKDRVRLVNYGKSVEGRPLRLVVVSSPENIARLDAVRAAVGKLADPRKIANAAEEAGLIRNTPVVTWINHCIHGSETASFEAVLWTLYTLAASDAPEVTAALQNSVVILNPVFNPDGHERFVVYYNGVAVGSPEGFALEKEQPWAVAGRLNHYRFDLNRDKIVQSQAETRQETEAFLRWNPQVFVDQHGQPETYFFPPNARAVHRQTDRARVEKWTSVFGRANGAAFDRYGWNYVNRETFDLFYPGYLDSWTTLSGAIGMTYETDGGGSLARRRDDETVSTLRDGTAHHVEAALATIFEAAKNREALLKDFVAFKRGAITAGKNDAMRAIVLLPGTDPGRLAELAGLLARVGVEVREARAPFTLARAHGYLAREVKAERRTFPAGALVVDLAQPQGRVARAFLEPDADLEPTFVKEQIARQTRNEAKNPNERREDYGFYDTTAWSLPLAYGVEAFWTEDVPTVAGWPAALAPQARADSGGGVENGRAGVAYLFRYDRDAAAFLALRLLQENFRLSVATRPLRAGGTDWPRGTIIARVARNPAGLYERLDTLARSLGVPVRAVSANAGGAADESSAGLGSEFVEPLRRPEIAVVADDNVSPTGFGSVWFLLDQAGIRFTSLRLRALRPDTLARFNVVVLPDGAGYASALGKTGVDRLKEWMRGGGALVGLAGGGTWFTDKEADISSASPVGETKPADDKPGSKPADVKKPAKPLSLPGAIFRARVDPNHFLGYGYPAGQIAVPLSGDTFLKRSATGANVVTFAAEKKGTGLRLSGFAWPDNTETLLAGTAYVVDEPMGAGHALLYLDDPTFRAFWPGLRRLFLSGVLFGPRRSPVFSPGAE